MKIEILGHGCDNCRRLEGYAREAVATAGIAAEVVHVTDEVEIARRGVLKTPGLFLDGRLVSSGRIPRPPEIAGWLGESKA
jgi:small redox-active disulfide protein 2